jgi:hypothetical protein
MANQRQFSKEDVLTGDVTYPAPVFNLTGPQWQILNGLNTTSLGTGAAIGVVVTDVVSLLAAIADGKALQRQDWYGLGISIALTLFLWSMGYLFDFKRRRLKKKINQKLLSNSELGL